MADSDDFKLRVFISSVQSEFLTERDQATFAIQTDVSLDTYFIPVLYENEPASSAAAIQECVDLVDTCHVYVLLVGERSGSIYNDRSITHAEFLRALEREKAGQLEVLVFKKRITTERELGAQALWKDVTEAGYKWKEFTDHRDFRDELVRALKRTLKVRRPDAARNIRPADTQRNFENASEFEQSVSSLGIEVLDLEDAPRMISAWDQVAATTLAGDQLFRRLGVRGHIEFSEDGKHSPTNLGVLVFGRDPTEDRSLANAIISAEAYSGTEISATPSDTRRIKGAAPRMLDEAIKFVQRNIRQADRVFGRKRMKLFEYPEEAIREAIINAIAHRDYDARTANIRLLVFSDRITVVSPGDLPPSLTVERLKSGRARPHSRNPLLAQSLFHLDLMDNRGTGYQRLKELQGTSGLTRFDVSQVQGNVELTLFGPGPNIDKIPLPTEFLRSALPASTVGRLTDRQKEIADLLGKGLELSSSDCQERFGLSRETVSKDFKALIDAGIAETYGRGPATRYVLAGFGDA